MNYDSQSQYDNECWTPHHKNGSGAATKATSIISYTIRFVDGTDANAKMANGQFIDVRMKISNMIWLIN